MGITVYPGDLAENMRLIRRDLALVLALGAFSCCVVATAYAQGANAITSPRDNAVVQGAVLIEGTAAGADFLRYELAFFKEFDPQGDWVVFATGDQPVVNGVLTTWDTTVGRDAGAPFYLDGTYRLRLRVVREDSNYDESFVLGISLSNEEPAVTPEDTPEAQPAASPIPTSAFALPTQLPTLTPFPSSTARPTAERERTPAGDQDAVPEEDGSFLDLEGEFSLGQIKSGICMGGIITLGFFGALAAYLLLRNTLRLILSRARSWFSR